MDCFQKETSWAAVPHFLKMLLSNPFSWRFYYYILENVSISCSFKLLPHLPRESLVQEETQWKKNPELQAEVKSLFFFLSKKCSTKLAFYNMQSATWQLQRHSLTKVCNVLTKESYFPLEQELTAGSDTPKCAHSSSWPARTPPPYQHDDNNNLQLSMLWFIWL